MGMAASVWRGRLAFGMVSIPVRLQKAARRERIRFRHVYREESAPEPEVAPPAPAARGKVHELPKRMPDPEPEIEEVQEERESAPETVSRVRNLQVSDDDNAPIEKPRILRATKSRRTGT